MDPLLRRALGAIARDRNSGAAELALRSVAAIEAWLRRRPEVAKEELIELARALLEAQPSMAPILRLANEAALAAEAPRPAKRLAGSIAWYRRVFENAPGRIARRFTHALRRLPRRVLATYSYSSTVIHALTASRSLIPCAFCSEGRPRFEGRTTARKLAQAGIPVAFFTDAALASRVKDARVFVCGADAIFSTGFVNKVGTAPVVSWALGAGRHVWVLADTTKFLPKLLETTFLEPGLHLGRDGPAREIWTTPPAGVHPRNPYFERVEFRRGVRILTERGWLSSVEIARALEQIRVSENLLRLGVDSRFRAAYFGVPFSGRTRE